MIAKTQNLRSKRALGRALLLAAFASLVLRAVIPPGYMPGDILAGEFMVLCPNGLPIEVRRALHMGHHEHDQDVVDIDQACPIGSALQSAWIPIEDAVLPIVMPATGSVFLFQPIVVPQVVRRAYDSRAPPAV